MIYVDPSVDHTKQTLLEGGITSGFGMPVFGVFVNVDMLIYVLVLFRSTKNAPLAGVPLGNLRVLDPELVIL
jgi:hypothetical protein